MSFKVFYLTNGLLALTVPVQVRRSVVLTTLTTAKNGSKSCFSRARAPYTYNNRCCYRRYSSIPLYPRPASGVVRQRNRSRLVYSVAVSLGRRTDSDQIGSINANSKFYGTVAAETIVQNSGIVVKMPEGKAFERLPEIIKPRHYALSIKPDLKAFTFEGRVKIEIEVGPTICRFFFSLNGKFSIFLSRIFSPSFMTR